MRRLAWVVVAVAVSVSALAAPRATADSSPASICGRHNHVLTYWRPYWRHYLVRNTYWLGTGVTCVSVRPHHRPGFVVTRTPAPTRGYERVTTFPDIFRGCIWNMCTPRTNIPIQVRHLRSVSASWRTVERARGMWNAAIESWFGTHRQTRGHADGAEMMVWLNHHGGCCVLWRNAPIVRIDGYRFYVQHWRPYDAGFNVSWNYIQFRMVRTRWKVWNLKLRPFINYSIRHGLIRRSWWLENVGAGFEIWHGGVGLRTCNFHLVARSK